MPMIAKPSALEKAAKAGRLFRMACHRTISIFLIVLLTIFCFTPRGLAVSLEEEKNQLLTTKTSLEATLKGAEPNRKQQLRKEIAEVTKALKELRTKKKKRGLRPVKLSIQSGEGVKTNLAAEPNIVTGVASYYAEKFNGRKTASGAIFSNDLLTAAHMTLPFGTRVRVTSLNTGKSVDVTINDRGPYTPGRMIDLSKAAFSTIDSMSHGIIPATMELLEP